ncbi:hypothetical protein jhhlp_004461 [Lomentospora prolificans]|uniref:NAD(P)-binding domain-containing protein n=1 Tax=Lomentospora prolificans TaxID=41688 RepID=A0A2N3NBM7_9PEZI|nr:hypothetical protein jhhlp_004461 [Lomentospora prolificans]
MPRRIAVVPASTKAGEETIRILLQSESKPFVRGVYRDRLKAPVEFSSTSNFEAVNGDVGSGSGLDFTGFDTVFYIPPPTYDDVDQAAWATQTANNVKTALQNAATVKKLLLFSAVGAQYDNSIVIRPNPNSSQGILVINHISDTILKDVVPEVSIIRPGYFHQAFAHLLEDAKADPPVIRSWITPMEHKIPMVSVKDVGETCANALISESTKPSPYYFKLFGPRNYSSADIRDAVEEITERKVDLQLVEKDQLAGYFGQIIPKSQLQGFVDMTTSVLPDGIMAGEFEYDENTVRGKVELVESLRELYKP